VPRKGIQDRKKRKERKKKEKEKTEIQEFSLKTAKG